MSQLADLARPYASHLVKEPAPGKYGNYVSTHVVKQKLLAVLGPYSSEIVQTIRDGDVITGCVLRLTCVVDGREVSVTGAGDVENPDTKKTNGARLKDAESDALKRAATHLGVGLHLYAKEPTDFFLHEVLTKREAEPVSPPQAASLPATGTDGVEPADDTTSSAGSPTSLEAKAARIGSKAK